MYIYISYVQLTQSFKIQNVVAEHCHYKVLAELPNKSSSQQWSRNTDILTVEDPEFFS